MLSRNYTMQHILYNALSSEHSFTIKSVEPDQLVPNFFFTHSMLDKKIHRQASDCLFAPRYLSTHPVDTIHRVEYRVELST